MLAILKTHKIQILVNIAIALFFLLLLLFPKGYNYSPLFLGVIALGYLIYYLAIKKQKWHLIKEEKWLAFSYVFYFAVFVLSLAVHQDKLNTLDNPTKVLLFVPLLLLFRQFPINLNMLLHVIPWGAFIAGAISIYHRFIMHHPMGFGDKIMHIQGGGMAMSLAMFSLVVTIYFAIQKRYKLTALYLVFTLMGMMSSFLSTARGAWIGLPFVVLFIIWTYRRSLSKTALTSFFGLITLLVVVLTFMPHSQIIKRFNQAQSDITKYVEKNNGATSLGARFDMWKSAWLAVQEKPLLGWGEAGIRQKKQQQAKEKIIHQEAVRFGHAHNQYIDDSAKRGIIGLFALLSVFFVPLILFWRKLNGATLEQKTVALLGTVHIVSMMFYCLSQGFFAHNSGNIFYFFLVIVFYAVMKYSLKDKQEKI
ncbi:O-antigen ligase [Cricetibacter osteomyelitidis]|uniref:O-antigen ligase n=1 Tax=Cricetibacter osteomyelitidis TaxID=1521931 RepID=A0A4R2SX54_9PAST|nr:O-antigen ligase [Cricetibacter osteomyelitidis]TCP93216.1 O-antigen ligase [Cricetibacter osteomyelitidis]